MKILIRLLIIGVLAFGGWKGYQFWLTFQPKNEKASQSQSAAVQPSQLPSGLPPGLEPSLEAARRVGAKGLRDFLTTYGRTISDPALASIELDYVILVSQSDVAEARRVFAKVKQRTPANSPVYPLVQKLQPTYE